MIGRVVVMPQEDYQAWLGGGATEGTLAQRGEKLFTQLACVTCHRAATRSAGPLLNGAVRLARCTLANGDTVIADDGYIRESILNPQAKIVAGFPPIMPTFQGQVSEEQLLALTEYIKSLPAGKSAPGAGQAVQSAPPAGTQPAAASQPRQ